MGIGTVNGISVVFFIFSATYFISVSFFIMVQCEFCLNFVGIRCIERKGVKYGAPVDDPSEEIDCPGYLEKGIAGLAGMAMAGSDDLPFFLDDLL